ncbi:hypothetical protein HMP0015_0977 [Acinetobacter haemolyticus ATCC 19194]|uniref:Uncharacterized protein n=1 Tax=Acinetobacter haemolyticus ATCC 19194 TaxID=707232 RepID=D4XMM4_ACIHA|nr:hypothetical protein HMP0015_0977 [Acinetobacter haemolyticus ATCC 19194]
MIRIKNLSQSAFALSKVKRAEHTSFKFECESSVQNIGIY